MEHAGVDHALVDAEVVRDHVHFLRGRCPNGRHLYVFSHPDFEQPMAFFGSYVEVTPHSRIVWTNEESADGALSTLTFAEQDGATLLVLHELYPSTQALDDSLANGSPGAAGEQFDLLDDVLATLVS